MPPAPKAAKSKGGRVKSTITFDDGRVEAYDLDRPIYLLEASEVLGLDQDDMSNPIRLTYWLAWIACGHPGVENGATPDEARAAARAWLANDVSEVDIPRPPAAGADVPPTTASRGASRG